MDPDNFTSCNTLTNTRDTAGSSELSKEEALAIERSMNMSMEFWGESEDPPDKIPAVVLKHPLHRSGKASSVALQIWDNMTQRDLEKIREIEMALMREGEVASIDLFQSIKSVTEGAGLVFDETLKSIANDPLESAISLTNEILHIYNQNEPPEIVEEDDYVSYEHFSPLDSVIEPSEREKEEFSGKIVDLLKKAEKLGLKRIEIPSSPYLSERSKFALVEKQVNAKMKVRKVQQAFINSKQSTSSEQKPEEKKSSLTARPKLRTPVKTRSLRHDNMIKRAPHLSERMKRVHEIRRKLVGKSNCCFEDINSGKFNNLKKSYHQRPYDLDHHNQSLKKRFFNPQEISCQSPRRSSCLQSNDSDESINSTKINIAFKSEDLLNKNVMGINGPSNFQHRNRHSNKESMLVEMKKILKEAVQEVARTNTLNHPSHIVRKQKGDIKNKEEPEALITYPKPNDEMLKKSKNDTIVTVTQEAPFNRPISSCNDESKVSTKVEVSKSEDGPVLKVSVVSKLSGSDGVSQSPQEPRNSQQNIQEAINVLKDYIALGNNENDKVEHVSEVCLIKSSEELAEVAIEPAVTNSHDSEESESPVMHAYALTMLVPIVATEGIRPFDPLHVNFLHSPRPGWLADEGGDVGDIPTSTWDSILWHCGDPQDLNVRRQSDSLYVNTSEECNVLDGISTTTEYSISDNSLIQSEMTEVEPRRDRYFISNAISNIYRFFTGVIFKTFSFRR